ncbi:MAG: tetratricopeptide repeat protein [Crocinitomicaceae bacterium]|nr:tetratricopeptide repeat protein [Crocinitomicaceae bacterium]
MNQIKSIIFFLFLLVSMQGLSQTDTDLQLAQYYYNNGEFDKAVVYYQTLYSKSPTKVYFVRYFDCLIKVKNRKEAEKILKRQINSNRKDVELKIMLGLFYEEDKDIKATEKIFSELIADLSPNPTQIIELSNAFRSKNKIDFALKTLEKGRKLLKDSYPLNVQFAEIYASNGDFDNMFKELINLLELSITQKSAVQNTLMRFIDFTNPESKEFKSLKSILLEKTQKNMDNIIYSEMLIWFYIQSTNFSAAITQSIALDKRFNYAGEYVLEVGKMALENRNYEQARKAFKYVISLGQEYPFYGEAERLNLTVRFTELTTNRNYSQQEIDETIKEFQQTIARLGAKRSAFELGIELAYIQAYFGNKSTEAITSLNELISLPGLTDIQKASGKMLLADIFVLQGEIWDASILYMQIDTDFKYEIIGQEAKYKNARIYYYDGEFDFAQSQLSVLKESTSRLIANDAIQLSTLITDNFGLDSNFQIMGWFAQGDLQLEQHKYSQAFSYYDSVLRAEPGHSLEDEILFRKAKAMELQGRWDDAIPFLEKIVSNFGNDILADDALFRLADIHEIQKGDKEKALEYFKKLLIDYKGSLYSTEARKRLRMLRGEKVIDGENDIENK